MSLIKQLWLAIIVILLIALGGSLLVAVTGSRAYIEQELEIKNTDNANVLAQAMSNAPNQDLVGIELMISAQFDTGYYRKLQLVDGEGRPIIQRVSEVAEDHSVPGWFRQLISFDVPSGTAAVQDGWTLLGTLEVDSTHAFAYQSLWQSTLRMAGWFVAAGALSLLIAYMLVRHISRPLKTVTRQAHDIGERRFTIAPLPRTLELREVSEAMNRLSESVREMLERESEQIDRLRRQLLHDAITGALTRDAFIDRLSYSLEQDGESSYGIIALIRATDLAALNERRGHLHTNAVLSDLCQRLTAIADAHGEGYVGRLNGSDFALLLCGNVDEAWARERLSDNLSALAEQNSPVLRLPAALGTYHHGQSRTTLMSALDGALSMAETRPGQAIETCRHAEQAALYHSRAEWRSALVEAMEHGVLLGQYPVLDRQGSLLHHEAPARLNIKGEWRQAGTFMPWIARLRLHDSLDIRVIDTALETIHHHRQPLGINLSHAAITQPNVVIALQQRLSARPDSAPFLWIEVPESIARADLESFRYLCQSLAPFGCHLGMEHVGAAFRQLGDLRDLGLSYIKIDATLCRGVSHRPEQQTILRGMATLCHSLAIKAIAEGIDEDEDIETLFELGLDGVTGPAVSARADAASGR
ncbi:MULTISPECIES: EAL domain-containing protein [Halomonas]|uniref:bifunctional diguanylate cyclase/phosphodiesterase n=1 Tax=Halomonas TaxID=2745 RepID=UPI001A8F05C3|nr:MULTISPECIES: EAL domain-containing protein [Halomonas]MBN8411026.1 EAL domain-containing protein [Halomonas litopenaei]MBY5970473.1 EAL domain-containing protein [Halomonas denitrificans]MED5294492.1 EAL domain-containing protein [Pseudomonadota bacterium]